jgi:hypothetical protein
MSLLKIYGYFITGCTITVSVLNVYDSYDYQDKTKILSSVVYGGVAGFTFGVLIPFILGASVITLPFILLKEIRDTNTNVPT